MKIISNERGRANQKLNPDEVRPVGGYYVPEAIRLLSDRYGFSQSPTLEEARTTGAIFKDGRLIAGVNKINLFEFGIHSDAIFATAQDTSSADFVLDDALTWAEQAIGLRQPSTALPRLYDNAIVVEFDVDIEKRLSVFNDLKHSYERMIQELYGEKTLSALYHMAISSDPLTSSLRLATSFSIERRVGSPFSSNRFFSVAPLRTEMHVELLEFLEKALS